MSLDDALKKGRKIL